MTTTTTEQTEAIETLRGILSAGDTVYTILRHVSQSGMTRYISTVIVQDGEPRDISYLVARAAGWKANHSTHQGIKVNGAGMDMGFHVVHSLSRTLFADELGANGGYALNHRWL